MTEIGFLKTQNGPTLGNPGYGNMMIRAVMDNAISEPVIETPQDNNSKID